MNDSAIKAPILILDQLTERARWLLFEESERVMRADSLEQVWPCLEQVQAYVDRGYYAVGFISFEAAQAFDSSLLTKTLSSFPYCYFTICSAPKECHIDDILASVGQYDIGSWRANLMEGEYEAALNEIKDHIAEGNTYQVNYTYQLKAQFAGDSLACFIDLYRAQRCRYAAYLPFGNWSISSVSPELFLSLNGQQVKARPMKGTIDRGLFFEDDVAKQNWLKASEKNRAENAMIVDMMRNDIGQLANLGSVKVDQLFHVESYPTLHQMTSTVRAETDSRPIDLLAKCFPCASITGAPKASTMRIIKRLEKDVRGIYTGSIGYLGPDRKMQFNVAIRTLVVNECDKQASYGVGGGIVWDSCVHSEYAETLAKAAVTKRLDYDFSILESLLLDHEYGYVLLRQHLNRMKKTASYFGFEFDESEVESRLYGVRCDLILGYPEGYGPHKVRLCLLRDGSVDVDVRALGDLVGERVRLSRGKVNTSSPFVHNKTTQRNIYDQVMSELSSSEDAILVNQYGNLTESCRANLVLKRGDKWLTPPLRDGLLNGVFRQRLVSQDVLQEQSLTLLDCRESDGIYLINSVRGWMTLRAQGPELWLIDEVSTKGPGELAADERAMLCCN